MNWDELNESVLHIVMNSEEIKEMREDIERLKNEIAVLERFIKGARIDD